MLEKKIDTIEFSWYAYLVCVACSVHPSKISDSILRNGQNYNSLKNILDENNLKHRSRR